MDSRQSTSRAARRCGLDLDGLAIDRDAEVPIGVQLAWALRSRIAEGALKPGQRLPGLRDLAEGPASTSTPSAPSTSAWSARA